MADETRPELRSYTPTARERLVSALGDILGGDPGAHAYANQIAGGLDFTPVGLLTGAYDIGRQGAEAGKKLLDALKPSNPVTQPQDMTKEEFFQARRSRRDTLEEAQNRADREARESPEYKALMEKNWRKSAEDLVSKRKTSAEQTWQKSQATIAGEEEGIGKQWEAELGDRERRRQEMLGRSFSERHPAVTAALPFVGLTTSAVLTRMGLNKLNAAGLGYATEAETARKLGDREAQALAIMKADKFAQSEPLKKLGILGGAPLANVEARALPDQLDVMTMPPESPARQRAMDRMQNIPEYALHSLPAYIGGAAATYTGSKFAGPSAAPDVAATRAYLRGMERNLSPQQVAAELAKRDSGLTKALRGPQIERELPSLPGTAVQSSPVAGAVEANAPAASGGMPALLEALGSGEGRLPPPAGAASSRPTYQGHPLPPGMELDSSGYPYVVP